MGFLHVYQGVEALVDLSYNYPYTNKVAAAMFYKPCLHTRMQRAAVSAAAASAVPCQRIW